MPRRFRLPFVLFLCFATCAVIVCIGEGAARGDSSVPAGHVVEKNQGFLPFADAPINYRSSDLNDPVAKLEKRLERGELKLHYDSRHGYLKSVLDALHISVSSQALVFSKTSFQFPEHQSRHAARTLLQRRRLRRPGARRQVPGVRFLRSDAGRDLLRDGRAPRQASEV